MMLAPAAPRTSSGLRPASASTRISWSNDSPGMTPLSRSAKSLPARIERVYTPDREVYMRVPQPSRVRRGH